MAKKKKTFSQTIALRAVVRVPVAAATLEEAQAIQVDLSDVASFGGKEVHDYRLDRIGVDTDNGWDFLDD